MRQLALASVCLAALAAAAAAQPTHGDLILTVASSNWSSGYTGFVRPSAPGKVTTISVAPTNRYHNWVRMGSDNKTLAVSEGHVSGTFCDLISLTAGGARSTIAKNLVEIQAFALDHDGHWVAASSNFTSSPITNVVLRIAESTGSATTFASFPSSTMDFNGMTIDRDPAAPVYVVAGWEPGSSLVPKLLALDARGRFSTVVGGSGEPLLRLSGVELHPRSGAYLTTDHLGPSGGGGYEVNRVSKPGAVSSLVSLSRPNGAKINQDDTAWIISNKTTIPTQNYLMHYDLRTTAVLSVSTLQLGSSMVLTGIEVYGSRPLVCNQPPTRTPVAVKVQSRLLQARGANYALAASFARRPGILMPNGEWLDLDVTGPLFYLSVLGALPSIFQNFQGTLDSSGSAGAQVNRPKQLPNLGITVFVAGVIFGPKQGVIQVTNTHWFVL